MPADGSPSVNPDLWTEVDALPEEVQAITMQVKELGVDPGVIEGSTIQHVLDLVEEPMDFVVVNDLVQGQWPREGVALPDCSLPGDVLANRRLFCRSGGHQVFFFAASTDDLREISEPQVTMVYRASGGPIPSEFTLLKPDPPPNGGLVDYNPDTPDSSGIFSWTESTPSNLNLRISYFFRLWNDETERADKNFVYESEPLSVTHHFLPPQAVEDDATYWWEVVAVDELGNARTSASRSVTIQIPNVALPGFIFGKITDKDAPEILIANADLLTSDNQQLLNIPFGNYARPLHAGSYTIFAKASGFSDLPAKTIRVVSGESQELNFELESDAARFTVRFDSAFGDPKQGEGSYLPGTSVPWSVTSPWPSSAGIDGERQVVNGDASGTVEVEQSSIVLEIDWIEEVSLRLTADENGSASVVPAGEWVARR